MKSLYLDKGTLAARKIQYAIKDSVLIRKKTKISRNVSTRGTSSKQEKIRVVVTTNLKLVVCVLFSPE